jgi:hypothetical protein
MGDWGRDLRERRDALPLKLCCLLHLYIRRHCFRSSIRC